MTLQSAISIRSPQTGTAGLARIKAAWRDTFRQQHDLSTRIASCGNAAAGRKLEACQQPPFESDGHELQRQPFRQDDLPGSLPAGEPAHLQGVVLTKCGSTVRWLVCREISGDARFVCIVLTGEHHAKNDTNNLTRFKVSRGTRCGEYRKRDATRIAIDRMAASRVFRGPLAEREQANHDA